MIDITPIDMIRPGGIGSPGPTMVELPNEEELGEILMRMATKRKKPQFIDMEA